MSHPSDPRLDRITRAFDGAFLRMCAASVEEDVHAELSNALSQFYRLSELCKKKLGDDAYYQALTSSDNLRTAGAIVWARTFDTHDAIAMSQLGDRVSDYFTEMFSVPVWRSLSHLPNPYDKYGRHLDYQELLEGRIVLDTIRPSFDALLELVS
jgi:hypothetical protein